MVLMFMYATNIFSQNRVSPIQQQFEINSENNYQEKVFIHTDKTVYATGEIIWLKTYITDAATNMLSPLSKICYVEITGTDKKVLLQGKIDVDSGEGNGSFQIPSSIASGNYMIRGYTNWMKNFDPQYYFEQPITIINPNKKPEFAKADSLVPDYIQFFPEGGNLVAGFANTVAFKITDGYGKGLSGKGIILSDKNDTVTSFKTLHFGMGTFSFTPLKGNNYHAVAVVDSNIIKKDLPAISDSGWVLHLVDDGQTITMNVHCNIGTEKQVFLFVQARNVVKLAKEQPLQDGVTAFTINKTDLGEGISQLTLFNEERQPVCERLYFKRPQSVLKIKLNSDKQEFASRQKVKIDVTSGNSNGNPANASMSAAVYLVDSLQPEQKTNIVNYTWLSSELKGIIESPDYYFDDSGDDAARAADDLMLTQGWRRFKWEDVLKNRNPSFAFLPEHEGHIITGKLFPKSGTLPASGIHAYLSVAGKDFKFASSISSGSGLIRFNVEKFYGSHEIIAQTNAADSNYRVFIDNPFSDQYSEISVEPLQLNPILTGDILMRSIGAQAQIIYQPGKKEHYILPVNFDTTAFFGIPSKTYYLDDYTRFPTMEEDMREIVKEVHVRKKEDNFYYEVFNEPVISYFNDDPLVLIDGVPVFNIDKIVAIDPLKIKRIDVTTTKFFQGSQQYDGIVSYGTYNGDLDGYQLDPNSLVVEYDGLQLEREFYSPQYETPDDTLSRIPDYRNVLYWTSDIKTKSGRQSISFYTSDIPGKYFVLVQGISDTGEAGYATTQFTVVPGVQK
jgi:hypothetical protein